MNAILPEFPVDQLQRSLRDLRISVTDRCNFRCTYCMPKEVFNSKYEFLARADLLTFEEIERIARVCADLGVVKFRVTGGEPLVRRNLEVLIERLAQISGIEDICMTTNGSLLTADKARRLANAGLKRITVSLDGINNAIFQRMNDVDFPVEKVLAGIEAAQQAKLLPVKVNMVVKRGVNDGEILPMAEYFRGRGVILRFIEFMDVGNADDWNLDSVLPSADIIQRIHEHWPLKPIEAHYSGEVARRWQYQDGQGEIGVISSVTRPFCGDCNRLRLAADGQLYLCLFASRGHDLKQLLRSGAEDARLKQELIHLWQARTDQYSEQRAEQTVAAPKVGMSYVGG